MIEQRLHHAGRAPGLYRAARHAGERRRGRPGPGLVDDPGPLPGARLLQPAARHRYLADPRDADRDRRRLRRQDRGLSRAVGHPAVAEVRQAGEDDDGARGGVPRLRPGAGRQRQGQDRRHARTAASSPPSASSRCRRAPSRARRSGRPACAASPATTSTISTSRASMSSATGPRSRPIARPARRSRRGPSSRRSTSWRSSSTWIRSTCA